MKGEFTLVRKGGRTYERHIGEVDDSAFAKGEGKAPKNGGVCRLTARKTERTGERVSQQRKSRKKFGKHRFPGVLGFSQ